MMSTLTKSSGNTRVGRNIRTPIYITRMDYFYGEEFQGTACKDEPGVAYAR